MMRQLIATLSDLPGASVDFKRVDDPDIVVAECYVPNLPNIAVCFSGSSRVLEWYLIIKDARTKNELWSDWMDYTGYGETDMQKLAADMQMDIKFLLDEIRRATDFRAYSNRFWWFFKTRKAEWLIDGKWHEVRLHADR